MTRSICQMGEWVLRQQARALTQEEIKSDYIQDLIKSMQDIMYKAPGVGLAAPQIGESIQLAVLEDRAVYHKNYSPQELTLRERKVTPFQVIINPVLTVLESTSSKNNTPEFFEGCLSATGFTALVPRAHSVKVECLNEHGEPVVIMASGWHARILQHEIDHLGGHLYLDRMYTRTFMSSENYAKYWADKSVSKIKQIFDI